MSEYIPIVALIAFIAIAGYAKFGHVARGHGGHISTELAGKAADISAQDYADSNYYGRLGLGKTNLAGGGRRNNQTGTGEKQTGAGNTQVGTGNNSPGTGNTQTGTGDNQPGTGNTKTGNGNTQTGTTPADTTVVGSIVDFAEGVWDGLKQQGQDLLQLILNPIESAQNFYALGEALFNDPAGTFDIIAKEIGQDLTNIVSGTAKQRGEVVGKYVSPAALAKVVTTLTRLGKIPGRNRGNGPDKGCSSFAAGTMVWTPNGLKVIESLKVGDRVSSRSDVSYQDSTQLVTGLLGRTVNSHYRVSTGYDEIDVTDEHPFWLQGRGWVEVKDLVPGNAVAAGQGDLLITKVMKINKPLRVYNFTVANTHTYFVSQNKLWVHNVNAPCALINANTISQSVVDTITATPKGQRPNPSTYLSTQYMAAHAAKFKNGVARIQAAAPGANGKIGRTETWVMPKADAQAMIASANGDVVKLENLLGLSPGTLGKNPVLVDIPNPTGYKIPTGNEFAASDGFWKPGGFTDPGGIPEAIIDPVLPGSYTVTVI